VLTSPCRPLREDPGPAHAASDTYDMVPVRVEADPLSAVAALVWSGDLPRQLQQVLADAAMTMS
jgi:hypothetical protein